MVIELFETPEANDVSYARLAKSDNVLNMRLALRFAHKALFVALPHMRKQLIRAKESFPTKLAISSTRS
jgi:hypothetical protein